MVPGLTNSALTFRSEITFNMCNIVHVKEKVYVRMFFFYFCWENKFTKKKRKNEVDDILQLKRESNFIHFSFINSGSNYPVDLHPEKNKKQKHIVFIFLFLLFQMKIKRYKFVTILWKFKKKISKIKTMLRSIFVDIRNEELE